MDRFSHKETGKCQVPLVVFALGSYSRVVPAVAPQHSLLPDCTAQPHLRLLQQQPASIRKQQGGTTKQNKKQLEKHCSRRNKMKLKPVINWLYFNTPV